MLLAALVLGGCSSDGGPGQTADAEDASVDAAPDDAGGGLDEGVAPDEGTPADEGMPPDEGPAPEGPTPFEMVDLFVGTDTDAINFGALMPGATTPFGMVRLSPDTEGTVPITVGIVHAGGYLYSDTQVMGFSHYHLVGVGIGDGGILMVTPGVGEPADLTAYHGAANLTLDHDLEHAEPGYYRLDVAEPEIRSELTATPRTGVHRYTFSGSDPEGHLVVDLTHIIGQGEALDSALAIDPETGEIEGFTHNQGEFTKRFGGFELFFVIRPSRAPTQVGVFDAEGFEAGATEGGGGERAGAVLTFDTSEDDVVELRVGVSFVDVEGARMNLEAEAAGRSFDAVRAEARQIWEDWLAMAEVEGPDTALNDKRARLFYTSLYRVGMMPTLLTDVDGRYRGISKEVHTAEGFTYYSDLSLWDTYRTLHPLVQLLRPDLNRDFIQSLVHMGLQGGSVPRWPLATGYGGSMLGTSADIVMGDAITHGYTDFDAEAVWPLMWTAANGPTANGKGDRPGIERCIELGYCASDEVGGSVSRTLEYASDDYCLARVADHVGQAEHAETLRQRSLNYENHWEPSELLILPLNADGSRPFYDPVALTDDYIEGTPWQYSFMVPHDVEGLIALYGGNDVFVERLRMFMELGAEDYDIALPTPYYWHGNEPDILAPWLFAWTESPELAGQWTAWVADNAYDLRPAGLAGNDDGGTLTAWYVFAGAGLYPFPCTGTYALAAPLFDRVVLRLPEGDLEITKDEGATPTLDGAPLESFHVDAAELLDGARITVPRTPTE